MLVFRNAAHVIATIVWNHVLQVGFKNVQNQARTPLGKEAVVKLIRDGFISAAERDIYTGDAVHISVVTKDGVESIKYPLRRD